MAQKSDYLFNARGFSQAMKEKRGKKSLRDIAAEIEVSPSTLLRAENGSRIDWDNYLVVCKWLDISPAEFFIYQPTTADAVNGNNFILLRASANISQETVDSLLAILRSLYLSPENEDMANRNEDEPVSP